MATKQIDDFNLSLLIYGIDLKASDIKTTKKMEKKSDNLKDVEVVRYIEDKDLFLIGEEILSSSRYNSGSNELEKDLTSNSPKYVYKVYGSTTVILDDISSKKAFYGVDLLLSDLARHTAFTSGFKTPALYKAFLNKDNLQFSNEKQLHDYIFYIIDSVGITEVNPHPVNIYDTSVKKIESFFKELGWATNGTSYQADNNTVSLVLEKNNWRYYLLGNNVNYNRISSGLVYNTNPHYSYIDADRQFYDVGTYDLNKPLNDIGRKLSDIENKLLYEHLTNKGTLEPIVESLIKDLTNAAIKKESFAKRQNSLSKSLQTKVEYKLKLLEQGTESFKLNEIEYTKDSIEYSGQRLEITRTTNSDLYSIGYLVLNSLFNEVSRKSNNNGYYYYSRHQGKRFQNDYLRSLSTVINSINDISFDVIYDEFMGHIYQYAVRTAQNKTDLSGVGLKIGDVSVDFTSKTSTNIKGDVSVRLFINGIKITKDDLFYCIHQAISYDDQKKYDDFLKSVSYTSLKIHRLTKTGVYLNFYDYIMQKNIELTIPVKRIKNRNYLIVNEQDKAIKKTSSIISLSNKNTILNIVKILVDPTVVENLEYKDLKDFIEKGQEAYELLIAKKDKLLNSTITALNINKLDHVILSNGNTLRDVYEITGAMRKYYVESKEPFKIYTAREGRYICMLDKTPYVSPEVKLINRFYALKNDSVISKEVATLDF